MYFMIIGGVMIKTHSTDNNSSSFEMKINEKKSDTLIIFFEKQEQLPTLNIPNMHLILICSKEINFAEGDIQSNFFCKQVSFVNKETYTDILKKQKKIVIEDHTSFSQEIFNSSIRHIEPNIQNCLSGAGIACELELIESGREVLVISGTGKYLDTLIRMEASPINKLHQAKIKEILCQPEVEIM